MQGTGYETKDMDLSSLGEGIHLMNNSLDEGTMREIVQAIPETTHREHKSPAYFSVCPISIQINRWNFRWIFAPQVEQCKGKCGEQ